MDSGGGSVGSGGEPQLLISGVSGVDGQPLILSAEDAAQFLSQAGLQLADVTDTGEQVIVGNSSANGSDIKVEDFVSHDSVGTTVGQSEVALNEINDGTILYIDPNDPQAAALLQQAGLTLAEDGSVQSLHQDDIKDEMEQQHQLEEESKEEESVAQELFLSADLETKEPEVSLPITADMQDQQHQVEEDEEDIAEPVESLLHLDPPAPPQAAPTPVLQESPKKIAKSSSNNSTASTATTTSAKSGSQITVGPDQQQVFYSVSGEDGKTQQYMMLCPKDMDQNTLITTLVRQISADPTNKGKKTIRITHHKNNTNTVTSAPSTPTGARLNNKSSRAVNSRQSLPPVRAGQSREMNNKIGEILSAASDNMLPVAMGQRDVSNVVDSADNFESVVSNLQDPLFHHEETSAAASAVNGGRVYVRCNYCPSFRSTLNSDTWEAILNHILPVAKEEIQTTFYGDLEKHFIRCVRIQVNGKQVVRTRSASGTSESSTPQCEVILTHSLVCRKTKREFIVSGQPDASFVANLAKHIRLMQPGQQSSRGNSLLCIFCNSPFTYEDYLRHIQPHLDTIMATLCCFSGAYCATTYENSIRAHKSCSTCGDAEPADLRFLPCTRFSTEYQCQSKLQFAVDCFRENYGDNGFMRLNTSSLAKCSVCKSPQQVYCAVFHITSTILNEMDDSTRDFDSELAVCVNCQKQFINIVMKEQGFDDKLKLFQLRNMEQLCSCLRVILGQARAVCDDRRALIYTVHENTTNDASAVHTVRNAEVTEVAPLTKLIALAESEVVGSPVKAFYMCDLCMFTIDLTSLIATPGDTQKNDMLMAIVLEHLVPHTESLMAVIANSSAGNTRTFFLKLDIMARVSEAANANGQRKIVLSLQKKFQSQSSGLEIALEKDEERTLNQLRASVKAERNKTSSFVNVRAKTDGGTSPSGMAGQLVDVNKFIDKQKGRLSMLAQCGCNTHLLNSYTECRLCAKFCFPDFRLAGASARIDLCESCVETVLTLCLPSEPECLEVAEECLALKETRPIGHRLVLANNVKKWLSLDGVNLIKKTIEEFNNTSSSTVSKIADCGPIFSDALKQHMLANLKTCHADHDIVNSVAGFCITDNFFAPSRDAETAAALASLQEQIGMPIRQVEDSRIKARIRREKQIEVKILARRPPGSTKKTPIPIRVGPPLRGNQRGGRVFSNGMVIDLGSSSSSGSSSNNKKDEEESVSAIQSFLDQTDKDRVKVPSGIKITSAGRGVVNIRAVSDRTSPMTSSPRGRGRPRRTPSMSPATPKTPNSQDNLVGSVRKMKGVSMVTLTAGGIIKRVTEPNKKRARPNDDDEDSDDEGDSDDMYDEESEDAVNGGKKGGHADKDYTPSSSKHVVTVGGSKVIVPHLGAREDNSGDEAAFSSGGEGSGEPRRKRMRKEKKIFDL